MRVISHGGGVQTTALLVLAAQRQIDYQIFLFANVGDDSEHPGTLRYLREIAIPYATKHGITIHELHRNRARGDGTIETIWERIMIGGREPIPVRMPNGKPGKRSCTSDFKIRVIGKWLKEHGATRDNPATVGVGISVDEIGRATSSHTEPYERLVYPLLDLRLRRDDCQKIIRDAGLPMPGKSACYFCPFHRPTVWQDMSRQEPELFSKACAVEDELNRRRAERGSHPVWLNGYNIPTRDLVMAGMDTLPGMDDDPHCDNGWCMT